MKNVIQFRVRYQETDQMGIVHHSVYYVWYEMGRTEWLRDKGLDYKECEAKGWLLPVVECGSKYLSPAYFDDLLELETELKPEAGASFRFEYLVRSAADKKVIATGFTRHVCIDRGHKIDKSATRTLKELVK